MAYYASTVTFTPVKPPGVGIVARLGDGIAVAGAEGGWRTVPRPKWVSFTEWIGFDPYTLTMPVLFDLFASDQSIESTLERFRQLMRPASTPSDQTPVIALTGPAVPMAHLQWVVTGMTETDAVRRGNGDRIRSWQTVDLMQYYPANVLVASVPSPAAAAQEAAVVSAAAPPASAATHTVRSGDTLWGIAAAALGDGNRWQEIADMNGIRDPLALQIGVVLRLPA